MSSDSETDSSTTLSQTLSKVQISNLVANESPRVTFVPNATGKAKCWKFFKHIWIDNSDSKYCICTKCHNILLYQRKTGTTTLNRHECVNKRTEPSSASSTESEAGASQPKIGRYLVHPAPSGTSKTIINKALTNAAVAMMAKDLRPFLMIEGDGFLDFCQVLVGLGATYRNFNIKEAMPKANTISANVSKVYAELKEKAKKELPGCFGVGFSSDFWVHDCTKTKYFTTTIHYVKEGHLFSRVLCTTETEDKTSNTTSAVFRKLIENYSLQTIPYIMVTDNAQSMIRAFRGSTWLGCSAHNLNLVLQHSYTGFANDDVARAASTCIDDCKAMVTFVKRSGLQSKLNTTLKQAINVRWDSHYDMLESIQNNYRKLFDLSNENDQLSEHYLKIDETVLLSLIKVLKPFRENRKLLCFDKHPTLHNVTLVKAKLDVATNTSHNDAVIVASMKVILKSNLRRYFTVTAHHRVATLLCPRFRGLTMASEEERTAARRLLVELMQQMYVEQEQSEDDAPQDVAHGYFDEFADSRIPIADSSLSSEQQINNEVTGYFNSTFSDIETDKPVLEFWYLKRAVFPTIAKVALWYLSVPASSAASERNFSYAGLTLTDRRSQLDPGRVNELLFIRSNFDLM